MHIYPYVRIYFDRGTNRGVLDRGPGTGHIDAAVIQLQGGAFSEGVPTNSEARPRWWMAMRNAVVVQDKQKDRIVVVQVPNGD